jgi:hypothetical protein
MPQTTTKASEITFYLTAAMLFVLVVLLAVGTWKTNSLSSNSLNSCSCTTTVGSGDACKFLDSNKDQFGLNKFINIANLVIAVITLIIVVARNFLLG